MEKLASRHAIAELMSWISLMENIIEEDQDKIMGAVGSEVVQNFLQKYKVEKCFFLLTPKEFSGCTILVKLHVSFVFHRVSA